MGGKELTVGMLARQLKEIVANGEESRINIADLEATLVAWCEREGIEIPSDDDFDRLFVLAQEAAEKNGWVVRLTKPITVGFRKKEPWESHCL